MPTAEWYHRKAEECVALAKGVRLNEERASLYALAEYYTRLAIDETRADTVRLKNLRTEEDATLAKPGLGFALKSDF
jgi:hypothetical protein